MARCRNGYCTRRRVSEVRLMGNARQFAKQTRSCSCKTHRVLHCSPSHFRKLKYGFLARNPAAGIENPGPSIGDRPFPTKYLLAPPTCKAVVGRGHLTPPRPCRVVHEKFCNTPFWVSKMAEVPVYGFRSDTEQGPSSGTMQASSPTNVVRYVANLWYATRPGCFAAQSGDHALQIIAAFTHNLQGFSTAG